MHEALYALAFLAMIVFPAAYLVTGDVDRPSR